MNVVADTIQVVVTGIKKALSGRLRSVYLSGSHYDGTAVSTSDIGLVAIVFGEKTEEDRCSFDLTARTLQEECQTFLDLSLYGNRQVQGDVTLKFGSRCVYGEDIREKIVPRPIEQYVWHWMTNSPLRFMLDVARGGAQKYPLQYPEPEETFYGYDRDPIENRRDTKVLMSIVSKAATALVAYETQDYIPTKAECLARYRKDIADEWTPLLEDVFELCKRSWRYQIPSSAADRAKLREICARTLDVFLGSEDHDPQEVDLVRQRIVFP